jgi:1-deoxy-D-xylulose-5-phosphate reductoisomerase
MVQFIDGSTLAQCSPPDMRLPIALALSWPERLPKVAAACDWSTPASWTFEPLDSEAFPAVDLARQAGRWGGTAPAVYNAANEECVEAFHAGRIGFTDICDILAEVLADHLGRTKGSDEPDADVGSTLVADDDLSVDLVLAADAWARRRAQEFASTQEHPH